MLHIYRRLFLVWIVLGALFVSGCASPLEGLKNKVRQNGQNFVRLNAGPFHIAGALPAKGSYNTVVVYIEGDGRGWRNGKPPTDPTPLGSLVLTLSQLDPAPGTVYLARPCQFLSQSQLKTCSARYWTTHRFGPTVLRAYQEALDEIKMRTGAGTIELVGYSGGATIATLVAAQRNDVVRLITISGLLDLRGWVAHHGVSPLSGSLDPMDIAEKIAKMPQIHLIGAEDQVVPPHLADNFVRQMGGGTVKRIEIVPGFNHVCCWSEGWAGRVEKERKNFQ